MRPLKTTLGTAGAALLLVLAAFTAGASTVPAGPVHVPLDAIGAPDEDSRDEVADDVGTDAVPTLGQAELLYVPINPCRIVDTRNGTGSYDVPLGDGSARTYYVAGSTGFPTQGGTSGGCGIPVSAMAVSATIIAWDPSSDGRIKAWPAGTTEPNAIVQMYGSGTFGTGATLTLTSGAGKDLSVRNVGSSTDLLIDVTGYYVPQLYAYLAAGGGIIDQSGRVVSSTKTSAGNYTVVFDRDISACVGVASSDLTGHIISVYTSGSNAYVYIVNNAGTATDYWVNLSIHC